MKNKIYPYTLEKTSEGVLHFIAKDARIDQEFCAEDLSELLLDLPNLIIAEQEYNKKRGDVIRFRVSGTDKERIEKNAIANGYDSVSQYVRARVLG